MLRFFILKSYINTAPYPLIMPHERPGHDHGQANEQQQSTTPEQLPMAILGLPEPTTPT